MLEKLEMVQMAHAMARHAGARMGIVAENVANADTPRYKARDIASFADTYQDQYKLRTTRPAHFQDSLSSKVESFVTDAQAAPNGNSVSLEQEMVKGAHARQEHDMALSIYRATSNVLRSALGRGAN